jgi:hypothetical protein
LLFAGGESADRSIGTGGQGADGFIIATERLGQGPAPASRGALAAGLHAQVPDRITDLSADDYIEVMGSRFNGASYDSASGELGLDTDANGSFETTLQLQAGLDGAFRTRASPSTGAASNRIWYVPDTDDDGYADDVDNAVFVPNPDQRDSDGDGYGNIVDADLDNSLMVDLVDVSLFESAFGTTGGEADFNGDDAVDLFDLSVLEALFGLAPGPAAGESGADLAAMAFSNSVFPVEPDLLAFAALPSGANNIDLL